MREDVDTPAETPNGVSHDDVSLVMDRIVRLGSALEEREPRLVDVKSLGAELKALGALGQRMLRRQHG
jgi:hypothetical protein